MMIYTIQLPHQNWWLVYLLDRAIRQLLSVKTINNKLDGYGEIALREVITCVARSFIYFLSA